MRKFEVLGFALPTLAHYVDYDVVIVGGGPGGYVAAIKAAQMGMKVSWKRWYSQDSRKCCVAESDRRDTWR